jgi:acyl carrier protein
MFSALAVATEPKPQATPLLRATLANAAEGERIEILQELVGDLVRQALNLAPEEFSVHESLHGLGVTSLQALEIRNELSRRAGIKLPGTLLFEHPTVAAISREMLEQLTDL